VKKAKVEVLIRNKKLTLELQTLNEVLFQIKIKIIISNAYICVVNKKVIKEFHIFFSKLIIMSLKNLFKESYYSNHN
jgi:hypothetical protein